VLELASVASDVVGCYAAPAALDRLIGAGEFVVRVAPDELLRLGERDRLAELEARLLALDEHGLVLDISSGVAVWALRGDDRFEAFCRLSDLELPEPSGVAQGLVAQVPAKVVVRTDELLVLVSSVVSHHLRERVLGACADLSPAEVAAAPPDTPVAEAVTV